MKVIHPTIQAHCHGFDLKTTKMKEEEYCDNKDTCGKKQEYTIAILKELWALTCWNHFSYSQK
jgi:hypothetical protein